LKPSVVHHRNRVNVISIFGLVVSWLLQFWYLAIAGSNPRV
jgi:hypothetical protein